MSMKSKRLFPLIFLCVLLISPGCSEDPSELGLGLISPEDLLKTDSLVTSSTSDTSFLYRVRGTSSALVGKYRDLEARTLIQYTGFSSIPQNAKIDSAVIVIQRNYSFMDSAGTLGLKVHEILNSWSQDTFLWDSTGSSGLYNAAPDTFYLKNLAASDTAIYVHIEPLVRRWVQSATNSPNGIILISEPASTNIITGSKSVLGTDTRPVLSITYRDTADTAITYVAAISQLVYLANGAAPRAQGKIYIQSALAYRGVLRFDNLSLPPKVGITKAILDLPVDNSASLLNGYARDSIVVYMLRKDVLPYDSLILATVCSPVFNGSEKTGYRADIKAMVQRWVTREENMGILLRSYAEITGMDRFVIYGSNSPAALRPKLTVTYTILP